MSKHVVALEDDAGYEQLLRNLFEGRGWHYVIGATIDEIAGSLSWAEVAVVDLDAAGGRAVLEAIRARGELLVVALTVDEDATPESVGADAVVTQLPGHLIEVINRLVAPPENLVDLTERIESGSGDRPWYVTS